MFQSEFYISTAAISGWNILALVSSLLSQVFHELYATNLMLVSKSEWANLYSCKLSAATLVTNSGKYFVLFLTGLVLFQGGSFVLGRLQYREILVSKVKYWKVQSFLCFCLRNKSDPRSSLNDLYYLLFVSLGVCLSLNFQLPVMLMLFLLEMSLIITRPSVIAPKFNALSRTFLTITEHVISADKTKC